MARQAAGGEKRPYAICDRLRKYVTDEISDKNLSVGFATASEVARNRQGDCSEHAVLLAALGRALGIPSRVVYGIVYVPTFETTDNVFGFHMWVQFLIGEKWVDFDPAQGESDCNPTHIAFTTSSMKDVSMADFAFPLLRIIGQLKLEVLEVHEYVGHLQPGPVGVVVDVEEDLDIDSKSVRHEDQILAVPKGEDLLDVGQHDADVESIRATMFDAAVQ